MFYAEENRYGLNTTTTIRRKGREIIVSAGNLFRFATKAERDAFVANGEKRQPLTAAEARRDHAVPNLAEAIWEDAHYPHPARDVAGYDMLIEAIRF